MTVTVSNDEDLNDPGLSRWLRGWRTTHTTGILITDDDTTSGLITLEVSPAEISEERGADQVTVTGTLHGKEFDDDIVVPLTIDDGIRPLNSKWMLLRRRAMLDYRSHRAPADDSGRLDTEGTTTITITPSRH